MKIETKDYHWTCGESGCCDEYGVILYIDGKEVEGHRFSSDADAYRYILEKLQGHEVDYIYEDAFDLMGDGTFANLELKGYDENE